jgi:hypothetical protein
MFNLDRAADLMSRLPIRDYRTQRIIPFIFTPSQRRVHAALKSQNDAGKPMRIIILKSRRQGISTYSDSLLTLHCIGRPGTAARIITHDFSSSKALFKVPKSILSECLPDSKSLMSSLNLPAMTQHKIVFPHKGGDSELVIATAGNVEGGRGMSLTDLHLSEMAMYPSEGTFAALLPTVPRSPDTIIIIESTAKGKSGIGQPFYDFWNGSVAGETDFTPVFLSWLEDPHCVEYDRNVDDSPIDEEEKLLMEEGVLCNGVLIKASKAQIAWRRMQISSPACRGVVEIFDQEYPRTPDVAFTSTGLPLFTPIELLRARNGLSDPKFYGRIALDSTRKHVMWTDDRENKNSVVLWEKPVPGAHYYFGIDAARGVEGLDFSAVVGVNGETGEQVLRWEAYVEPEALALFCYAAGIYYNKAMLCIELTGNLGYWVQTRLRNFFMYPNLYKWRGARDDKVKYSKPATYGWETTYRSREALMTVYRESIANSMFIVRDSRVLQQMELASRKDAWERWEIVKGHDDVLFAAMLANMARYQWHVQSTGATSAVTSDADHDSRALAKLNPQPSFEHLGTVTAEVYKRMCRDRDRYDAEQSQRQKGWLR